MDGLGTLDLGREGWGGDWRRCWGRSGREGGLQFGVVFSGLFDVFCALESVLVIRGPKRRLEEDLLGPQIDDGFDVILVHELIAVFLCRFICL